MGIFDNIPAQSSPLERIWSPQQNHIFEEIHHGEENLLIQACAGSGKTTTIVAGMEWAGASPLFLAFNKSVQLEISRRLPNGEAKTLNSLGFGLFRRNLPGVELDTRKNSYHLKNAWEKVGLSSSQYNEFGFPIVRAMGVMKNLAVGTSFGPPNTYPTIEAVFENYWIEVPEEFEDSIILAVQEAYEASCADRVMIDFDDQLLYPILLGWKFPLHSDVFVDECQDLSPIQHAMIEALSREGARVIAVGDRYQAIYGFRGASHQSMDLLLHKFSMNELPLSTTYRCPQAVVLEAQRYCPTIQAREGAPFGAVTSVPYDPEFWDSSSMILCRNNAPLFRAIMRHVRAKRPVIVLSNFLDLLKGFIKSFKAKSIEHFRANLDAWYWREKEEAEKKEAWGKLSGIIDRYETLCVLAEDCKSVDELLKLLDQLSSGKSGPTFSTIHKAKGLEKPHIHLLRPDILPSPYARGEDQELQERNLSYVAITRAEDTFTYGEVPKR